MTRLELLELIKNGENSGVEFKRDTIENYQLTKELVAFANLRGGKLLLGVDDDGGIVGLTRAGLEEWLMQACRDKIRPSSFHSSRSCAMLNQARMLRQLK